MIIQICSDLHLEKHFEPIHYKNYITPNAQILVLVGDIGSLYRYSQLEKFLIDVSKEFEVILFVPGNHEYQVHKKIKKIAFPILKKKFDLLKKKIKNIYILDNESIIINNYCFIGSTLWSKTDIFPKSINIHGIDKNYFNFLYDHSLNYIKKMIKYSFDKKLKPVILTHYCPSIKCLNPNRKIIKQLYSSNLDYLINNTKYPINSWIYGHSHYNNNFTTKSNTKIISNQLGKSKSISKNFKCNFVIDI